MGANLINLLRFLFICNLVKSAEDIDEAVLDRCDESLFFPLPDSSCRSKLLTLYYNHYVHETIERNNKSMSSLQNRIKQLIFREKPFLMHMKSDILTSESQLNKIVDATQGFSGREIGKLMVAIQSSLYYTDNGSLTVEDVMAIVDTKVREHREKRNMIHYNANMKKNIKSPSSTNIFLPKLEDTNLSPTAPSAVKRVSSAFRGAKAECDTMMEEVKRLF